MRKLPLVLIAAISLPGFAAMIAPASGQNPAPEVTPETTAEAAPFEAVLRADTHCGLTPDEKAVVIPNDGVYDLVDGSLRYTLPMRASNPSPSISFTFDGTRMLLSGIGVFDLTSGNQLIESITWSGAGSATDRWYAVPQGIYDMRTGERVYDMLRERVRGYIIDIWLFPATDFVLVRFMDPYFSGVLIDIPTGEIVRELDPTTVIGFDASRIAVAGDGLYKRGDESPLAVFPPGNYWPVFSPNLKWLALIGQEDSTDILVYDAVTGVQTAQISIPTPYPADVTWLDDTLNIYVLRDVPLAETGTVQEIDHTWTYAAPGGELLSEREGDPVRVRETVMLGETEYPAGIVTFDDARRYAVIERRGLYDARTGEQLLRLTGYLRLTRDGMYLVESSFALKCAVYRLPA